MKTIELDTKSWTLGRPGYVLSRRHYRNRKRSGPNSGSKIWPGHPRIRRGDVSDFATSTVWNFPKEYPGNTTRNTSRREDTDTGVCAKSSRATACGIIGRGAADATQPM